MNVHDLRPTDYDEVTEAALLEGVASGQITPSEAGELSKLVDGCARAMDLHDIQQRLEKLEAAQGSKTMMEVRLMSRNTRARVVRLENATVTRRSDGLLVATDRADAERLRAQHPNALIIITGVPSLAE